MGQWLSRGLIVWFAVVVWMLPAYAVAPLYQVIKSQSTLSFVGLQEGDKFTGMFKDFSATIHYAATDLPGSSLDVVIHLPSLDTRSLERDQALISADWFDVGRFPDAKFRTVGIRQTASGPVGDADLTIKGRTKRIAFPFVWKTTAGGATLDARASLNRLDFGLGAGEWADAGIIGHSVEVVVHLVLTAVPSVTVPAAQSNRR
jgi:polyisoprenoid-binding protein YceI